MYRIIILILLHIAGDFILQDSKLSKLKASRYVALFTHVGIYTIFFIAVCPLFLGFTFMQGLVFSLINGGVHLVVDFFTSRLKKLFWPDNEGKYIVVISIDHTLHLLTLVTTYIYLYPQIWALS